MNKQPRPLTEWELAQLQGMRNMTKEEMIVAQRGYQAIPKEELKRKQLEANPEMQNHTWPWE